MAKFSGSALYATWVYSGGTVTLSGNQRSFDFNPDIDLIDVTAGADAGKARIPAVADHSSSFSFIPDQSTFITVEAAVKEGTQGTLNVSPWGTASGTRKYILPCISKGAKIRVPYADVVEMNVDFSGNGTVSYSTN